MNKRLSNIELLRLVAMFMVIVLHYLYKSSLLTSTTAPFQAYSYLAWLIESFAIVAVNAYVLISGYFMCKSSLKISRLLDIFFQALWYSVLIPVVLILLGILDPATLTTYDILQFIFPVHMEQYWFITAYVVMMLFVPILNLAIKHMNQKQFLLLTVLLTGYELLPKSILPFEFAVDEAGYNALWLICLYLIGAYIRIYGISFFENCKKSLVCYVLGVLGMYASLLVMRVIYFKWDAFGKHINFAFNYNHIFCLFTAIAFFYTFLYINIPEGKISTVIRAISPYTLGVYLLHEHSLVRYEWVKWFGVTEPESLVVFVVELVLTCLIVFVVGIGVDFVRAIVFRFVANLLRDKKIFQCILKWDACLKG